MFFTIVLNISLLLGLANAHGYLEDPKSRSDRKGDNVMQYSGGLMFHYYYRGGENHVCGSNGWADPRHAQNTQITGPVVKTYQGGATVNMTARFTAGHEGYIRIKLCKLNDPKEQATQECFDQNLLKIKPLDEFFINGTTKIQLRIDDHTIRTPKFRVINSNGQGEDGNWWLHFSVKLPAGLSCDNCVILWDWHTTHASCQHADGKQVGNRNSVESSYFLPNYGEAPCAHQQFRSCADIKIEKANTNEIYVPNPVKRLPYLPPVYSCSLWNDDYYANRDQSIGVHKLHLDRNTRPDPNMFVGAGLHCFESRSAPLAKFCDTCRLNCMSPDKKCPSQCFCRWFAREPKTYQNPIEPGKWNL